MSLARKLSTEAGIQRGFIQHLELQGFTCWRQNAAATVIPATATRARRFLRAGRPGISDILGIVPLRYGPNSGRFFALEAKKPGGDFRPGQIPFLQRVNADGGLGFWADDIATVQTVLKWLARGRVVITVADDGSQGIDLA